MRLTSIGPTRSVVVAALAAPLVGCHTLTPRPDDPARLPASASVITAEQIASAHVTDAWELLRQTGRFRMEENANGIPVRLESRRGRSSILIRDSDTPILVVDGARMTDFAVLREISASSIELVRILGGRDATTYYGTNAGGGVIIITTKTGADRSGS
jgi:outer membrane receptor for ferrienterochelin and colicin